MDTAHSFSTFAPLKNSPPTWCPTSLSSSSKDRQSLKGVDAVITPTGRKGSIRPYSHHQGHVRRLIVLTPPTVRDPRTNSACWPLVVLRTTFATFVRNVARDIVAVGDVVRSVGADLYCLAGLHPSDSDTNEVIAGYMGDGKTISVSLRAGAAAFVIQELEKREWVRKASMLSAP
ncbi:hypothetical protein B0H10DRAFT_831189 [Mycena sp. CBHHK59/15]|nr:hypothetical protein B0H10DRAFT_831189 [Mycena sp. CBHHK59/15]